MISLALLLAAFGADGLAFSPYEGDEQPTHLLETSQGNLVVVGRSWGASTSSMLALTFNVQGDALGEPVALAPGTASSGAFGGAFDAQGRVVVVGYAFADHGQGLAMDAVIARLTAAGAVDDAFPPVLLDVHGFDDAAASVAVLDDGRIVAVGRTTVGFEGGVVTTQAVAWLLDDTGALLDTLAFAVEGEQDELIAVDVDAQGRIVAAGNAVYDAGGRASVVSARMIVNSGVISLDDTWDADGIGVHDPGAFFASSASTVHARAEGGAFIGATIDNGGADPDFDLALVVVDDAGALLRTTSASVHTMKGEPEPTRDNLRATAILEDGSAVLLGDSDGRLVVVRVGAQGALAPALIEIAPCGTSARGASLVAHDDGAVLAAGCFLDPFYADLVLVNVRFDDEPPPLLGEGEGEGEPSEGEGEGEGEGEPVYLQPTPVEPAQGCGCAGAAGADAALWAVLALVLRRARRPTP